MERGKKKAAGHLFLMCLLCVTVLLLNGTKVYATEYDGGKVEAKNIQAGDIFKNYASIALQAGEYIDIFLNGQFSANGGNSQSKTETVIGKLSYKVTQISKNSNDWTIYLETYPPAASTQTQEKEKEKEERKEDVHQHSYQWMTVTEPAMDTDGVEEYRCSCGEVESRQVIPATETYVKTLYGEIREAPENGSIGYDAGTDLTALLEDEEYFYGYFTLCEKLGITVEVVE